METDHRQWEESGLRAAVLRGDTQAWRALYDRCFESLYAFIDFRTGHDRHASDEVAQESWTVAVRRIEEFDPTRAGFGTWLRGIAANVLRNYWRSHERAGRIGAGGIKENSTNPQCTDEATQSANPALAERIGLAMTALPERHQAVIRAKYEEQLSVTEIAEKWGETPKAVESLLFRARQAFRDVYSQLDKEP